MTTPAKAAQDAFRALGAACDCCGTTRHYVGEKTHDDGRVELLWNCWRCAYYGQAQRVESAFGPPQTFTPRCLVCLEKHLPHCPRVANETANIRDLDKA